MQERKSYGQFLREAADSDEAFESLWRRYDEVDVRELGGDGARVGIAFVEKKSRRVKAITWAVNGTDVYRFTDRNNRELLYAGISSARDAVLNDLVFDFASDIAKGRFEEQERAWRESHPEEVAAEIAGRDDRMRQAWAQGLRGPCTFPDGEVRQCHEDGTVVIVEAASKL